MRLSAAQCIALTGGLVLRSSEASEGDPVRQCSSSEHRWGEAVEKFLNKVLKCLRISVPVNLHFK